MPFFPADLKDITIPNGGSTSNAITLFEDAYGLGIQAPATLTASQVTIQVSVSSGSASVFADLLSGNTTVVFSAGQYRVISPIPARQLRITSSSAEGADRTFQCMKVFQV